MKLKSKRTTNYGNFLIKWIVPFSLDILNAKFWIGIFFFRMTNNDNKKTTFNRHNIYETLPSTMQRDLFQNYQIRWPNCYVLPSFFSCWSGDNHKIHLKGKLNERKKHIHTKVTLIWIWTVWKYGNDDVPIFFLPLFLTVSVFVPFHLVRRLLLRLFIRLIGPQRYNHREWKKMHIHKNSMRFQMI